MRSLSKLIFSLLVTLVAAVSFAAPAVAQDLNEIIDSVEARGYYIEPGANFDINTIEALTQQSTDLDKPTAIIILAREPQSMVEDEIAAQVIDSFEDVDAAVVLWGEVAGQRGLGAAGIQSDAVIDSAADAVVDASVPGSTLEDLATVFVNEIPDGENAGQVTDTASGDDNANVGSGDEVTADAASASGDNDSGGGFPWIIVLLPGVGLLIWWWMRRSKRKREEAKAASPQEVEVARAEIREQLKVVANEILEHENTVGLSGNDEAINFYRQASETYKTVSEQLPNTTSLLELADLNDQVDKARWQMDAAEALIEGRPVPPEPEPEKPAACFFDPTHKPGTHEAVVKTNAGDKEVNVCGVCAEKLEKGERPEPRMIDVGGRKVPAAKAPQSHGGRGMGGLDIFSIILGGLGQVLGGAARGGMGGGSRRRSSGIDLDWGDVLGPRRRTKTESGVFGPDRLPPRRSGGGFGGLGRSTSRSSSRRSSGRTRRSGGSRRSRGRSRRRM